MTTVNIESLAHLAGVLAGDVILPGDLTYDEARKVSNGMIDKRPGLIVRCSSAADVATAVAVAREHELTLAVRCGGHSVAGLGVCDGGIVIDLAPMKGIEVDRNARLARAGGGVLWGEFDRATQEHGLATPGGRMTTTGLGGFTLGGGYGWLSSRHGLACDNLVAAEVVTADGRIVTASADENEDLLWGLRGGGGNFGVVTSYVFRVHEVGPTLLAGIAVWPMEEAPRVMRAWRDYVEDVPDELSSGCVVLTAPAEDFVPEHLRGRRCFGITGCYVGDVEDGARAFAPIKRLRPDLDLILPVSYLGFQALLDPYLRSGWRSYSGGHHMTELSDGAIDVFLEHAARPISPYGQTILLRLSGAISAVGEDATAVSNRRAGYMFHPISYWEDPADDESQIGWTRAFLAAMAPFTSGTVYLNFIPESGSDAVRAGYGIDKHARLVALKDKYDPVNRFRMNHNIEPSASRIRAEVR